MSTSAEVIEALYSTIQGQNDTTTKAELRAEGKTKLEIWQRCLTSSSKGQWTNRIERTLPKIHLPFDITQFLSARGCFQQYLHKMSRTASHRCVLCTSELDTVEYTMLHCSHFDQIRVHTIHADSVGTFTNG